MPSTVQTSGLPNLVIVGERRSGTTWLSQLIARHPAIFVHPKRDRGYFIDDEARKRGQALPWEDCHGTDDYRAMFRDHDIAGRSYVCEKSADYLFWRPAHERLARTLPEARYIAILRHPVRRAWSHYWIEVGKGRETEEFSTAVALEQERSATNPFLHNHLSYKARGFYDNSIEHFRSAIPAERLLVVTLEELIADRAAVLRTVFGFLGIEGIGPPQTSVEAQNRNWVMTPRPALKAAGLAPIASGYGAAVDVALKLAVPDRDRRRRIAVALKSPLFGPAGSIPMDADCERALAAEYAPHVRRLEAMLGRSFGHWGL